MKEVIPGIYLMTLNLPDFSPDSVNIYLIKTNDGYMSIDTGWDSPLSFHSMEEQLAEIGAQFTDIKQVIVTHCHIDHLGMIARFKQSHETRIYLHRKETGLFKIRFTNQDNFLPLTDSFLQTHGVPAEELVPPEVLLPMPENLGSTEPDIQLIGGEEIAAGQYTLRVINTPGHTPGHIALYEPHRKFLFSGDVLLPTIATNAAMHIQHILFPVQKYLNSLLTLRDLDIDLVLPGHEYPFSNHRQRIEELLKRHQGKTRAILKAFTDTEPKTAYDISRILARSPKTQTSLWPSLSGWDRRFAVLQTIAYLESLRFEKKITLEKRDSIHYYRLKN